MKIALINFTYNKKSGIENVADSTLREINKIDTENKYMLFVNASAKDYYITSPRITKKVVKMTNIQMMKTLWLLFVYPLYSLIKGIDITIIFNCSSNFALSFQTRNVIYIHDLGELIIDNKYDMKRMIYRKFLSLPINRLLGDVFIVVSTATQRDVIEKLNIDEQKVQLIYNGTDDRIQKLDKDYARQSIADKYKINDSDKIIISIGRIDPVGKNLIKLIEAVDVLRKSEKGFHVFLIGELNFPNSPLVPEEIEKRNLNTCITLPDYVETDELNLFYNAADLMVFPSIYEGFGLPLLEAMKCELPVACSDIEVFHEVADKAAVYFNPNDSHDMADKISLVLNSNELGARLIDYGKDRFPHFTWDHAARQLLDVIKMLQKSSSVA